ncbi:MAG: transketolase [Actinomycetota bacterium]|nr:transketolase [Actinomycetota bacterium]
MDAPHAARSGHQGTAMALAPLAHVLWTRIMNYDAADPGWQDRDRFILSAGHASILLYSMLHLTGTSLTIDDLKDFRQWGSATPGHPERGHTLGVEVTTGPLGQGIANAVGMAVTESNLRARFGADVVDHHIFCIAGDGDLSEGVSHEAASLAGHLGLGRLVCVYDDNHISIDGPTELALTDDAPARFRAYGWHVEDIGEAAEDLDAMEAAIRRAMEIEDRPSLIVLRSHIAFPSPDHTDDPEAHGYALKDEAIAATKAVLGLPVDETFYVPDDVLELYRSAGARGSEARDAWKKRFEAFTGDREALEACWSASGLPGWKEALPTWAPGDKAVATRKASGSCLAALAEKVPALVAGGADLTGNTGTVFDAHGLLEAGNPGGRQLHFGVREHAMASSMTGMALHGGLLPVGGTFLVFSDYCRPALRLAALSRAKVVYSFTHDSVGVGEDGPTHQPVEHVASLRAIPGLCVIRPADANETAAAWRVAMEHDGPTALILSRQDLPVLDGTAEGDAHRGAYALRPQDDPDLVLIGTGSEVAVCIEAAELLAADGTYAQVVSMPSWDRFAAQDPGYQDSVLPPEVPTLAVEAGTSFGWERWADDVVGIDRFGASAPGDRVLAEYGFTAENVADRARELLDDLEDTG